MWASYEAFLKNDDNIVVHEFIADYLALLKKSNGDYDKIFSSKARIGSNFYKEHPYIRECLVDYDWNLVDNIYDKSSVLVTKALKEKTDFSQIANILKSSSTNRFRKIIDRYISSQILNLK